MRRKRILVINGIILATGLVVAEMIPYLMCRNTRYAPTSLGAWLSQPFIFTQTARQAFLFWGSSIGAFTVVMVITLIWVKVRWLSYTAAALWMVCWSLAVWGAFIAGMIG